MLQMPSGVSYGAEAQFEMEGRIGLRLAHFLSAYYQNNIVGELYGNLRVSPLITQLQPELIWGLAI